MRDAAPASTTSPSADNTRNRERDGSPPDIIPVDFVARDRQRLGSSFTVATSPPAEASACCCPRHRSYESTRERKDADADGDYVDDTPLVSISGQMREGGVGRVRREGEWTKCQEVCRLSAFQ